MEQQSPYNITIDNHAPPASQPKTAASRDDAIRAFVADLLDLVQERADMSDAWRAAEMAALDKVLGEG